MPESWPPPWLGADKAYQAHHARCPHCKAAGLAPGKQPRCADGAKLWQAYRQAVAEGAKAWVP